MGAAVAGVEVVATAMVGKLQLQNAPEKLLALVAIAAVVDLAEAPGPTVNQWSSYQAHGLLNQQQDFESGLRAAGRAHAAWSIGLLSLAAPAHKELSPLTLATRLHPILWFL